MALQFESKHFDYKPTSTDDGDLFTKIYTNAELMKYVAPPLSYEEVTKLYQASLV